MCSQYLGGTRAASFSSVSWQCRICRVYFKEGKIWGQASGDRRMKSESFMFFLSCCALPNSLLQDRNARNEQMLSLGRLLELLSLRDS
jgi:hypothetical protein